ncbi:DUF402 domain-containing protein [Metabacillus bambusae]|uniref:DUF402 domain-containing protein n=1 Tax=Metabacillus bambusae TaxID=2795218 RepID=A0ABS3MYL3_9BACI|nr:DUF402 domain-containing protein [Metabacillus bambusae]MBO1511112.1 DUF402 domain-containing protein [Metabacillus bambusae]
MLKRKYGDRPDWKRVIKKEYRQLFLDTEGFKGYISLIKINSVLEPLYVQYGEKRFCIVDDNYIWLQHFPSEQRYSVTTMFNPKGEVVQWYIDICKQNGIENNVPWMDDLFLDIVVLPTGDVIQKDTDELEDALNQGIIDEALYNIAWIENNNLKELIKANKFDLMKLTKKHKNLLLKQ